MRDLQAPLKAKPIAEKATELDPTSADAAFTLALICYRLDKVKEGDKAIEAARKNGKYDALCALQQAIARYHSARRAPYARDRNQFLKEAEFFLEYFLKHGDAKDMYYRKNKEETYTYLELVRTLRASINRRDFQSQSAAGSPR